MHHLVEKFSQSAIDTTATNDDGVVAIEYVLVAGFVAAGIAVAFTTGMWSAMKDQLDNLV